jgi:hypothetical protein
LLNLIGLQPQKEARLKNVIIYLKNVGNFSLNIPVNIPWKLIAVSPDMMDTQMCNKHFPPEWRSSIAISVYEPAIEDLPAELCDRITYIKVTCSITGYQPTAEDKKIAEVTFPDIPIEKLNRVVGQYFACYGTLLNVSVGPPPDASATNPFERPKVDLKDYPHIIDFEPKTRDLYQTTTEEGEILTASRSEVNTSKGYTNADTTENGLAIAGTIAGALVGATVSQPQIGAAIGGAIGSAVKWGDTTQNSTVKTVDDSRERRERHATTTTLSQMYNLLTSYHAGTNRASFLMLARPHILQPTLHRTFIQGVRVIEGIQEFFLIVARPKEMKGLSIETFLETGHFPEDVEIKQNYDITSKLIDVGPTRIDPDYVRINERRTLNIDHDLHGFEVDGWEFDPSRGDAGRPGIHEELKHSDDDAQGITGGGWYEELPAIENYSYETVKPDSVKIKALIRSNVHNPTTFHRRYRIFLRKQKSSTGVPEIDIGKMIITSRGLCTSFISGNPCPQSIVTHTGREFGESVVDERKISINRNMTESVQGSHAKFIKEGLRKIQNAMTTSAREFSRRPYGSTGFIDTDYFKDNVAGLIPKDRLEMKVNSIHNMPQKIAERLGKLSVQDALSLDLPVLARQCNLSLVEAAVARRVIMGISTNYETAGTKQDGKKS